MHSQPLLRTGLGLTAFLAACSNVVDLPPVATPIVVVELVLVAGEPTIARIRSVDAPTDDRPIDPASVDLAIVTPGGTPVRLQSLAPPEGTFTAALPVEPGKRYRLEGTIGTRAVIAETTVPSTLSVVEPAGPIRAADLPGQFRFRATGATVFTSDHILFPPSLYGHTRDSTGQFTVSTLGGVRPAEVSVYAMNRDAERYFFNQVSAEGNITGAAGVFGAALVVRRAVQWP